MKRPSKHPKRRKVLQDLLKEVLIVTVPVKDHNSPYGRDEYAQGFEDFRDKVARLLGLELEKLGD